MRDSDRLSKYAAYEHEVTSDTKNTSPRECELVSKCDWLGGLDGEVI